MIQVTIRHWWCGSSWFGRYLVRNYSTI